MQRTEISITLQTKSKPASHSTFPFLLRSIPSKLKPWQAPPSPPKNPRATQVPAVEWHLCFLVLRQSQRPTLTNTISKCDLGFTQLANNSANRLPTSFQPKSQDKASRRCSQASVQQCINISPWHMVGRTPEAPLLGKDCNARKVEKWKVTAL